MNFADKNNNRVSKKNVLQVVNNGVYCPSNSTVSFKDTEDEIMVIRNAEYIFFIHVQYPPPNFWLERCLWPQSLLRLDACPYVICQKSKVFQP